MAIPGFTGVDMSAYNEGEYAEYLQGLSQALNIPYADIQSALKELRDTIKMGPNTINTDGKIDLTKFPLATRQMWQSAGIVIYGNPDDRPVYFGWIDGVKTLIFGEMAVPYISMASLPGEQYIIPPNLVLLSTNGVVGSIFDGDNRTSLTVNFAATFMTIYGETVLSNIITIGPILEWGSVTLGVVTEDIPEYATHVYYYRSFGDTFRRVQEVKL